MHQITVFRHSLFLKGSVCRYVDLLASMWSQQFPFQSMVAIESCCSGLPSRVDQSPGVQLAGSFLLWMSPRQLLLHDQAQQWEQGSPFSGSLHRISQLGWPSPSLCCTTVWGSVYPIFFHRCQTSMVVWRFSLLISDPSSFFLWQVLMEEAMATHSSTLAWKIPWTEEPGRLQSMGSRRVRHDWAISLSLFTFMHWIRKWQPPQCSCLENPRDGGAWWAAVCGVAQSRTQLSNLAAAAAAASPLSHLYV